MNQALPLVVVVDHPEVDAAVALLHHRRLWQIRSWSAQTKSMAAGGGGGRRAEWRTFSGNGIGFVASGFFSGSADPFFTRLAALGESGSSDAFRFPSATAPPVSRRQRRPMRPGLPYSLAPCLGARAAIMLSPSEMDRGRLRRSWHRLRGHAELSSQPSYRLRDVALAMGDVARAQISPANRPTSPSIRCGCAKRFSMGPPFCKAGA